MLKVKSFFDAEFLVKRIETGPIRIIENGLEVEKELLSNVIIDYKGFEVGVGSGFSKEQRELFKNNPELIVGHNICVKYFEETKNQNGTLSLRFPIFKSIRDEIE